MAIGLLASSDIEFEAPISVFEAASSVAIPLGYPAYDCSYLALAAAIGCAFVAVDEALVNQPIAVKVTVLGQTELA